MSERRYFRVGPAIWAEDWDDDATLVALYILTCGHRTTEGLFRLPLEYAVADLGATWSLERFRKGFDQLLSDGFVEYDESARVCLIVKALEWQSPDNENQVKSALKKIADLPRTPLLGRFLDCADAHCERLADGLRERFAERLAEPIGNPQSLTQAPSLAQEKREAAPDGAPAVSSSPALPKVTYNGKRVDADTVATAVRLLDVFNEAASRNLGATTADAKPSPTLKQIVGAMRARPEVSGEQWEQAIRRTVASPPDWVDGPIQIGHVFGERAAEWALAERTNGHDATGADRFDEKFGGLKA